MPVPGRLLVTVADTDQNRLAPRPAQNLKAGRQVSAHETHRNGHRRKPGRRRNAGAVVAVRRVEIADQPRRVIPGWIDQCAQFRVIHRRLHGLRQTPAALLRDDAARVALRWRLSLRVAHRFSIDGWNFPEARISSRVLTGACGPSEARYAVMSYLKRLQNRFPRGIWPISAMSTPSTISAPCPFISTSACSIRWRTPGSVSVSLNSCRTAPMRAPRNPSLSRNFR